MPSVLDALFFFYTCCGGRRDLHSFPYTTLFRSQRWRSSAGRRRCARRRASRTASTESPGRTAPRHPPPRPPSRRSPPASRSEEHTSELQSLTNLVCRLLLEKKN